MPIHPDLIDLLRKATSMAALTGAGVSSESGVPTFRDAQTGLWARYSPQELATPEAFHRNPRLVWEWYAWRRELVANASPNPAHLALVELEERYPDFTLITQNVDGLHRRAGSHNILELHGDILRTKCSRENRIVEIWEDTGVVPPLCPDCGAPLRPDVVWFGEDLPADVLCAAQRAAESSQVFLSIGTSSLVEPAASLPFLALQSGSVVVEINLQETPLTTRAAFVLHGLAGTILPELIEAIQE
jgi:NAD-dependent deacetylase